MKAEIERSVFMGVLALFAVAGLFVASRASEGTPYWGGLLFSAVCVGGLFYSIAKVKAFR
ncbi:hypothetical protein [Dongia sp.]|uniref:hypothetical protein n=1 Tax=Dongia sp. TaxID=1977262 RepID=UPI0035B0065B